MLTPAALATRRGLAYAVASHGVLQQQSKRHKCPVALLHTLLALHTVNDEVPDALPVSTGELQRVMHIRLPLLREYIRELTSRDLVKREQFFRRGARLLCLTAAGHSVARECQRELKGAATQLLESRGLV